MWRATRLLRTAIRHTNTRTNAFALANNARSVNSSSSGSSAKQTLRAFLFGPSDSSMSDGNDSSTASSNGASSGPAAAGVEEQASAFVEAVRVSTPPKKKVYRPFHATHEWQAIDEDHILPPGLWIKFDLESGTQRAKIMPPPGAPKETEPEPEAKAAAEEPAAEESAAVATAVADASSSDSVATDSSSAVAAASSSSSSAASAASSIPVASRKSNKVPSGSRGISTSAPRRTAKPVNSSRSRPAGLPVFPVPSETFLAARAILPSSGPSLAVAPMVDVSDRHYRFMMRLISKHAVLYSPMIVDNAVIRAPHAHALFTQHRAVEHPLVAQIGGSEAGTLVAAALRCEAQGFQAININVGCPAPSAIGHKYGACLMREAGFPAVVGQVTRALAGRIPLSIKCRIGLNGDDSYEFFRDFVKACHEVGGVTHFIVHARKAILNLKSAGKNLTIPKLNYEFVFRLKKEMPHLRVEINGGVETIQQARELIEGGLDGVMLGRVAWKQPYTLATVDKDIYGDESAQPMPRKEVMERYLKYVEEEWEQNMKDIEDWKKFEADEAAAEALKAATPAAAIAEEAKQPAAAATESTSSVSSSSAASSAADAASSSVSASASAVATAASTAAAASSLGSPSLVPCRVAPAVLDLRTLLKPIGYLYTHEPGYRHFRLLFEEGLLRAGEPEWSMRRIVERAMTAVEPPPARLWGQKDEGFDYTPQAKEEMEQARAALAAGGAAAAARHAQQQQMQVHAEQLARAHAQASQ